MRRRSGSGNGVPVDYGIGFSGPVTALTGPPGRAWRRSRPICQPDARPGIKTCASPAAFSHDPHLPFFSSNCPARPPSCLRPRRAPPAPVDVCPLGKEYDAASEKNALRPLPALVRSTFPSAVSPRPCDRGPTPESDVDAVPGFSRSPITRLRDSLRRSFSAPLDPIF